MHSSENRFYCVSLKRAHSVVGLLHNKLYEAHANKSSFQNGSRLVNEIYFKLQVERDRHDLNLLSILRVN